MFDALVIGYGSPLRGDDGVGWKVIDALAEAQTPATAQMLAVHQLTPELAEPVSQARLVVFIDAAVGDDPGQVRAFPIAPGQLLHGTHQTTPDGLLSLATDLFGRRPPAWMVTVIGESFDLSEELTPVVAVAVQKAAAEVLTLISQ